MQEKNSWERWASEFFFFFLMNVFWISGEEKVILDNKDGTNKGSGTGRKESVTGNMTGTAACLLL